MCQPSRWILIAILLLFPACFSQLGWAQTSPADATAEVTVQPTPTDQAFDVQRYIDESNQRKAQVLSELETARSNLEVPSATDEISLQLKAHIDLLSQIDGVLIQEQSVLQKIASQMDENQKREADIRKIKEQTPPEEASYLELDQIQDDIAALAKRQENQQDRLQVAQTALEQAQKAWEERETARRAALAAAEANQDPNRSQLLLYHLRTARTESRYATEALRLRGLELRFERLAQTANKLQTDFFNAKKALLEPVAVFTEAHLQEQLQLLAKEKDEIEQLLRKTAGVKDLAEKRLNVVRTNLAQKTDPDRALIEEGKARERELEAAQLQIEICSLRMERMSQRVLAWQRRYEVVNNLSTLETEQVWLQEAQDYLKKLATDGVTVRTRLIDRHNELTALQNAIDGIQDQANPALRWLKEQQKHVQSMFSLWQDNASKIELSRQLHEKLIKEIEGDTSQFSLRKWGEYIKSGLLSLWNKEIYVYRDKEIEKSYYIKTIFFMIFFFAAGFIIAKKTSRSLGRFLMTRVKIHEGAANTVESLIYYLLLIIIFFYALRFLNIPLTVFTMFGGALAIGVGFGSQNIFNNFISGLILLAERPVRVGDLIEVDGVLGRVARLGGRCTQIRTFNNLDVIVPNSAFLEKRFTNWTLQDRILRTEIKVGVAYNSPTREVEKILADIIEKHEGILKDPQPSVFFVNLGESTLDFEMRYFVNIGKTDKMRLDSEIRHKVMERLTDAGINVAFPQRDIHLTTLDPLAVHLISQSSSKPE
ncbi:MAG: mechanosensitive ion channel [bacterium]|jgi:small-conductance mechanosensitive channel|nr:mechanosensitive ion channel [bacterium]